MILAPQRLLFCAVLCILSVGFFIGAQTAFAKNVTSYSDTISDSRPLGFANHTFSFTIQSDIAASGYLNFAWPAGFTVRSTSTFSALRNVEMIVNGIPRSVGSVVSAARDQAVITTGAGGSVRYNLNSSTGLSSGDQIVFKVGNHTTDSNVFGQTFSTTTGTSTTYADVLPIQNASTTGVHKVALTTGGATEEVATSFVIFLLDPVGILPINTFETVPPFRFNGAPEGTIGGTTLNVEISVETNEFAVCRFGGTPGTDFFSIGNQFDNTGSVVHSEVISVLNSTTYTFYVRCIDDEGNFNIDDYVITFTVPDPPEGEPNEDGEVEGDGTGTGNDGTGSEDNTGSTDDGADGTGTDGGSTSSGGGGGGGGGGSGGSDGSDPGGGFENGAPYESGDGRVIINGYAFPGSDIVVLVDGGIAERSTANSQGRFSVSIDEIARGSYTFGVYAIGDNEVKSSTFSTTFTVSGARTSNLSNITIMPSILVDPDPVDPGQILTVSGYSIPNATVSIENEKENSSVSRKTFFAESDGDGFWSTTIETNSFSQGTYKIRAKSEQAEGVKTGFSDYTFYGVGQEADVPINADLNRDGSVNLTDFSILLFWWGGDGGDSDPPADINGDGTVSLTDFSILLFNWTG